MAKHIIKSEIPGEESPFENIKRVNEAGNEHWSSRDFARVLGYSDYRNFEQVVEKAKIACFNSGQRLEDHFVDITDMIDIGKGGQRPVKTTLLSRYACYLSIQNADPAKEIVALGQTYFAVQTRRQELTDEQIEEDRRLLLRNELKKGQQILDHMGSTELAANLFRATQAEEKLRREKVQGKPAANRTHFEVGRKVRQTIQELGGTMPESLPTAESIKKFESKKKRKQLGDVD